MSGVVASGSPFAGASLTVIDRTGATVCDTSTDAKGAYSCILPPATVPPLAITARRDDQALYSVSASLTGGRVNVTPLTTIVVSRLSPNGDVPDVMQRTSRLLSELSHLTVVVQAPRPESDVVQHQAFTH